MYKLVVILHLPPRGHMALSESQAKSGTNLHSKDTGYPDGTADSLQTQRRNFWVITVLQANTVSCQQWSPDKLNRGRN